MRRHALHAQPDALHFVDELVGQQRLGLVKVGREEARLDVEAVVLAAQPGVQPQLLLALLARHLHTTSTVISRPFQFWVFNRFF